MCKKGGPCEEHEPELFNLGKSKRGPRRGEVLAQGHRAQVFLKKLHHEGALKGPELQTGQRERKQCLQREMLGQSVVGEGTG